MSEAIENTDTPTVSSSGSYVHGPVVEDHWPESYQQVREALVREIRDAERWSAVVEAWEALQAVRRRARQMKNESEHLNGTNGSEGSACA
jgi:hypothetical protein